MATAEPASLSIDTTFETTRGPGPFSFIEGRLVSAGSGFPGRRANALEGLAIVRDSARPGGRGRGFGFVLENEDRLGERLGGGIGNQPDLKDRRNVRS
jgi:hypothetical protein